jgi:hypothetical protein
VAVGTDRSHERDRRDHQLVDAARGYPEPLEHAADLPGPPLGIFDEKPPVNTIGGLLHSADAPFEIFPYHPLDSRNVLGPDLALLVRGSRSTAACDGAPQNRDRQQRAKLGPRTFHAAEPYTTSA